MSNWLLAGRMWPHDISFEAHSYLFRFRNSLNYTENNQNPIKYAIFWVKMIKYSKPSIETAESSEKQNFSTRKEHWIILHLRPANNFFDIKFDYAVRTAVWVWHSCTKASVNVTSLSDDPNGFVTQSQIRMWRQFVCHDGRIRLSEKIFGIR